MNTMKKETVIATAAGIAVGASSVIIYQAFIKYSVSGQSVVTATDFRSFTNAVEDVKRELKELRAAIQGPSRQSSGIFKRGRTHSSYIYSHPAGTGGSSEDEEDFFEALDGYANSMIATQIHTFSVTGTTKLYFL